MLEGAVRVAARRNNGLVTGFSFGAREWIQPTFPREAVKPALNRHDAVAIISRAIILLVHRAMIVYCIAQQLNDAVFDLNPL
jgi:hypothetical protein